MDTSFSFNIKAYRTAAARRFLKASTSKKTSNNEGHLNDSQLPHQHAVYQRANVPGLREYLRNAAKAYIQAKAQIKRAQRYVAQALGHGKPVQRLHVTVRRERWLRLQSERKHFIRVTHQLSLSDVVVPCGIPRDVLERAASQFLYRKRHNQRTSFRPPSEYVLGRRSASETNSLDIREDPAYALHIKRCEDFLEAGNHAIITRRKKTYVMYDNFEDVRRRYAGKPDELYRRKTARRYATWRRRRQEEDQILFERELTAEREMKRRRGLDQLLTSRPSGDSSFVPFLYELSNNTYAYSSKITLAPKLRKMMIDKYTESTAENIPEPKQCQKARQTAQTNGLFHTRVMNRFS